MNPVNVILMRWKNWKVKITKWELILIAIEFSYCTIKINKQSKVTKWKLNLKFISFQIFKYKFHVKILSSIFPVYKYKEALN